MYLIDRAQAVADREITLLQRFANEASARQIGAEGRATGQSLRIQRTQRLLDKAIEQRAEIREKWENAKALSSQVPEGRATVGGFPELQGVDFPAAQANVLRRAVQAQQPARGNVIEGVNALARAAGATLDVSANLIQGLFALEIGRAHV